MGEDEATPRMVGKYDGIPNGLDRVRALGNAIVPQIAEIIGLGIIQIENLLKGE